MNRRKFIETSLSCAALASFPFKASAATHRIAKVGMQLYTARDAMKTDFDGTLAKVAAIGYKEVEFAGYFGHTPKQVRAAIDKNGLAAPSCHVDYAVVEKKWDETIEAAHTIGHRFIVCPWIDESQRKSADGYKRAADLFSKAGEISKKAGIQFAYHNHTFEFQSDPNLGGKMPYDFLLESSDPNNVKMELDLCWISVAGKDPLAYFSRYPGRFPLVHVKDMKELPKGAEGPTANPDKEMPSMTEVGSGVIDWKRIFAKADQGGIQHFFVEHDTPKDAFASLATSYAYLAKLHF